LFCSGKIAAFRRPVPGHRLGPRAGADPLTAAVALTGDDPAIVRCPNATDRAAEKASSFTWASPQYWNNFPPYVAYQENYLTSI
jgi:hypothetical protein